MSFDIRELTELDELREVAELFAVVWERPGEPPISSDVLRALSHSGNYIAGARAAGKGGPLIGGIAGWLGMHAPVEAAELHMHSHILGVLRGDEARGLGFALKLHQRTWCLERGVRAVEWTFDPLVRRNAHFNLTKLGAEASEYLVDFYGGMNDGINAGDESDRILVRWDLDSPKAVAAAGGRPFAPDLQGDHLLVQVPEDIVAIRRHDPELARRWRHRVREELGGAMSRGYRVTGLTRDYQYVLRRSDRRD